MKKIAIIALSFVVIIFAYACTDKAPVAKAAPQKAPQQTVQTETETKEAKTEDFFVYDKKGKRDPFVSLILKTDEKTKKGQTPLESYDVGAVKIIGIAWNQKGNFAEIVLPDGKAYTLREGMTIGLHEGKIYKITKNSIYIREQIKDYKGQLKTKETILRLREEEE